ncbi:hypothetical protein [Streptomyces musisoli]|uniref:hypothetical protein n=1 Tax=Streptomyces TaxID=1883 RepID=UPI003555EAA4
MNRTVTVGLDEGLRLRHPGVETASLAVVGRRIRMSRLGTHTGHVAHAFLRHAEAPVAVIPHD